MNKTILYLFLFLLTATLVLAVGTTYGDNPYGYYKYGEAPPQPSTSTSSSGGGGGGGGGGSISISSISISIGTPQKFLLDGNRDLFDIKPSKSTTKEIKVELKEKSTGYVSFTYTDLKTFESIPDFKSFNQFEFTSDTSINYVEFTIETNLKNPQVLHLIGTFWKDEPITSYVNGVLKFKVSSLSKFAVGEYVTINNISTFKQNVSCEEGFRLENDVCVMNGELIEVNETIIIEKLPTTEQPPIEEKQNYTGIIFVGLVVVIAIIGFVYFKKLQKTK